MLQIKSILLTKDAYIEVKYIFTYILIWLQRKDQGIIIQSLTVVEGRKF